VSLRTTLVGRILGIEVRVHVTWLALLVLVALAVALQPSAFPDGFPDVARFIVGMIVGGLFFASVLIHELAHALAARRRGLPGGPVLIVVFAGLTAVDDDSVTPNDEFVISVSGPLVSIAVGVPVVVAGFAIGFGTMVGLFTFVVGAVNVMLGALNLVPAFPLDGGRALHAMIWRLTGDSGRAVRYASRIGRVLGSLTIGVGLLVSLAGDGWTGVVILISGWFVIQGARVAERRQAIEELLVGIHVEQVMERDLPELAPTLTVDTFADQLLADEQRTSVPVVDQGSFVGVIGIGQLRRVARQRWTELRAADIMVAPPALPFIGADDAAWDGLEMLRRSGLDGIPVMSGSDLLGLLTRRSLVETIQARAAERSRTPGRVPSI
jgi:Zn-dependent protease